MLWQGPNVSVFLDNSFNSVSCRQASTVCCGRDLMFLYSLTTVSAVYLVDRHQLCAVAGT